MKNLDFARIENRFLIPKDQYEIVLVWLLTTLKPIWYDDPYRATIYLNDDNLIVPWGVSIKARRHFKDNELPGINMDDPFGCEIKKERWPGSPEKIKQKFLTTLGNFCLIAPKIVELPVDSLKPHILIQCRRLHFVPKNEKDSLRITLDQNMRYWFFEQNELVDLGKEDGAIIEIKIDENLKTSAIYQDILALIKQTGAFPTISKKEFAYNLHSTYLDKYGIGPDMIKELPGLEIEAKFEVTHPRPIYFLHEIKKAIAQDRIHTFSLSPYDFTKATASINYYWIANEENKAVRMSFNGDSGKITTKEETSIIPDSYGLNCIMKRKEKKGKRFVYSLENFSQAVLDSGINPENMTIKNYLQRSRRAIWPENMQTGRIYHISVDRCVDGPRILYQLEIEYVGIGKGRRIGFEKDIVQELQNLTWQIYQLYPEYLIPSKTTKLDWLIS